MSYKFHWEMNFYTFCTTIFDLTHPRVAGPDSSVISRRLLNASFDQSAQQLVLKKKSSHLNGNLRKMNGSVGGSHFIFNG